MMGMTDAWLKSLGLAELEQTLRELKRCSAAVQTTREFRELCVKVRVQIRLREGDRGQGRVKGQVA